MGRNRIEKTKGIMLYFNNLSRYEKMPKETFANMVLAVMRLKATGEETELTELENWEYGFLLDQVNKDEERYLKGLEFDRERKKAAKAKKYEVVGTYTPKDEKVPQNEEKGYSEQFISNVHAHAHNKTVENTFQAPIGNKKPDVEIYDSAKLKEKEYEVLKNDISYMLKKYPETEEEVLVNRMHNIHNIAKEDVIRCLEEIKSKNQ